MWEWQFRLSDWWTLFLVQIILWPILFYQSADTIRDRHPVTGQLAKWTNNSNATKGKMNLWPGSSILIICAVVALGLQGPSVDASSSSPGVNSKRITFSFKQRYLCQMYRFIARVNLSTCHIYVYMRIDKRNSWVLSLNTYIYWGISMWFIRTQYFNWSSCRIEVVHGNAVTDFWSKALQTYPSPHNFTTLHTEEYIQCALICLERDTCRTVECFVFINAFNLQLTKQYAANWDVYKKRLLTRK